MIAPIIRYLLAISCEGPGQILLSLMSGRAATHSFASFSHVEIASVLSGVVPMCAIRMCSPLRLAANASDTPVPQRSINYVMNVAQAIIASPFRPVSP